MTEKLSKLLALANRPGTPAEGQLALRRAEAIAAEHGLEILRLSDGRLMAVDEYHADLLRGLLRIAGDEPTAGALT